MRENLDLPEVPSVSSLSSQYLRSDARLPMTKDSYGQGLSLSGGREQDVLNEMAAMKAAFNETKAWNKRSKAIAKAKNRSAQKAAERR